MQTKRLFFSQKMPKERHFCIAVLGHNFFLDFSRYSSTGVSVYFTLTDFFFIAFQYVSAKFSERILSFSSLVKKFCQFFLTSEAFFPFSSLVKAFSHLK